MRRFYKLPTYARPHVYVFHQLDKGMGTVYFASGRCGAPLAWREKDLKRQGAVRIHDWEAFNIVPSLEDMPERDFPRVPRPAWLDGATIKREYEAAQ
jgi:hypothetical protein